jgi:hypothetical protein
VTFTLTWQLSQALCFEVRACEACEKPPVTRNGSDSIDDAGALTPSVSKVWQPEQVAIDGTVDPPWQPAAAQET